MGKTVVLKPNFSSSILGAPLLVFYFLAPLNRVMLSLFWFYLLSPTHLLEMNAARNAKNAFGDSNRIPYRLPFPTDHIIIFKIMLECSHVSKKIGKVKCVSVTVASCKGRLLYV